MPGVHRFESVERFVDAAGPAARLAMLNEAAGGSRLVDRLAETRGENLFVRAVVGRGHLQLAEQGRIALGEVDDHRDEDSVRLIREMGADAGERAGALFGAVIDLVRGERRRHHVLAEAIVVEGRTVTLALDRLARAEEIDAVVLRSGNLRQHASRLDVEDLDASVAMIGFAASESRACETPQSRNVEAREIFDCHVAARLPRSMARAPAEREIARANGVLIRRGGTIAPGRRAENERAGRNRARLALPAAR